LSGCTLSNGTDTTNDINFAAGVCRDSTDTVDIVVSATAGKQLDANWAAGAAAGMRNSAAGIANGTYHIYAGRTAASSAADFYAYAGVDGTDPDSSATIAAMLTAWQAESGGASYVFARRIGSILRESASIVQFVQHGSEFRRTSAVLDVNATNPGTSAVSRTLSVPSGLTAVAIFNGGATNFGSAVNPQCYFSPLDMTDQAPSATAAPLVNSGPNLTTGLGGGAQLSFSEQRIKTNTSRQIRTRLLGSDGNCVLSIATVGWLDSRGRD
jgi:hypothetical protein